MNKTSIEWCDFTANPIRYRCAAGKSVWACVKASEGCQHCYAEALAHRYQGREFTARAMEGVTPYMDDRELKAMLSPAKLPAGSKVFVGDMTDMFGPWVPFEMLDRVFAVFVLRPDVVFQVLTKRPERMREYLSNPVTPKRVDLISACIVEGRPLPSNQEHADFQNHVAGDPAYEPHWPLPNVWLGTSVENQHWADVRIPELLATPAAVRFVSAEPLLGPIDTRALVFPWYDSANGLHNEGPVVGHSVDWVIVGGESGPGARSCDVWWIRSIVAQCKAAGVPVFVKQLGSLPRMTLADWKTAALAFDPEATESKLRLKSRKGGNPDEWPEDLRVREWPQSMELTRALARMRQSI